MPKDDFRDEELLADVICRLIGNVRHVAIGVSSPNPATAALLAWQGARIAFVIPKESPTCTGSRRNRHAKRQGEHNSVRAMFSDKIISRMGGRSLGAVPC